MDGEGLGPAEGTQGRSSSGAAGSLRLAQPRSSLHVTTSPGSVLPFQGAGTELAFATGFYSTAVFYGGGGWGGVDAEALDVGSRVAF